MKAAGARFPRLYAAASLKPGAVDTTVQPAPEFSAALCRGLIEALARSDSVGGCTSRFPRLYAAASLKHHAIGHDVERATCFPRLYAAASLKRQLAVRGTVRHRDRFPRLYAAASLKREPARMLYAGELEFSAALCRGLIEARVQYRVSPNAISVFRGFMPRPH